MEKKFDIQKVDRRSTELVSVIAREMARPGLSIQEFFMVLVASICKLLQIISAILDTDPKDLANIIKQGLDNYNRLDGDEIISAMFDDKAKN